MNSKIRNIIYLFYRIYSTTIKDFNSKYNHNQDKFVNSNKIISENNIYN